MAEVATVEAQLQQSKKEVLAEMLTDEAQLHQAKQDEAPTALS